MRPDRFLPHPLDANERTIPRMLTKAAEAFGQRPLFRCGDASWTYEEAPSVAARMAGRLAAAGIAPGDRIAILSTNRAEVMQVLLGCGWLGAVAVPINVAVKAPQLRYYLADSGARILIAEAALLDVLPADVVAGLPLERIWTLGTPFRAFAGIEIEPFEGGDVVAPAGDLAPDQPFAILYTSGTTGPAKGVVCPHAQFYWWGVYSSRFLEVTPDDVLVTSLPLFHTNALNCATVGYVLGAMVPILLAQPVTPAERQHRLRVALGPGVPAGLHDALFERTGLRLVEGFGSTETNFVIGGTAAARVPGRMGRLSEGISARIVDANEADVPDGEPGELLLRADAALAFSSGYFGRPEATIAAWRPAEGCHPPTRREYLVVRCRARAADASRHRGRGGLSRAVGSGRGRGHGRRRTEARCRAVRA
jgi:crotonobetaine/carnitine-CoA ligase